MKCDANKIFVLLPAKQAAGKAINTYFQKTSTRTISIHTGTQKREFSKNDNFATIKRRVLETSPVSNSFVNISSIFPPTTQPYQHKYSPEPASQSRNVIVESRSRFFGHFDTIDTSDDCDTLTTTAPIAQDTRSSTPREDSGIGLDEAALLLGVDTPKAKSPSKRRDSMTKSPKKTCPATAKEIVTSPKMVFVSMESKAVEEEVIEYKRAEAKVIQGWREKFSNTAQPGRTPGLKRAFQNCGRIQLNPKVKPAASTTASSGVQPTSHTITLTGASTRSSRTVEPVPRTVDTQLEAAEAQSGPSIYHLDAGRRALDLTAVNKATTAKTIVRPADSTRRFSGSSSPSPSSTPSSSSTDTSQSIAEEEDVRPKLCLDRFRFTASSSSAPVRTQH